MIIVDTVMLLLILVIGLFGPMGPNYSCLSSFKPKLELSVLR